MFEQMPSFVPNVLYEICTFLTFMFFVIRASCDGTVEDVMIYSVLFGYAMTIPPKKQITLAKQQVQSEHSNRMPNVLQSEIIWENLAYGG